MTIAADFSGISVTVHVGAGVGEPAAREYDDPQPPVSRDQAVLAVSNKVIESREDALFWIMVRRTRTYAQHFPDMRRILCFILTVDGLTVAMTMWRPSWGYPAFVMDGAILERSDHPQHVCRPFRFSAVESTNEDNPRKVKSHIDYIENLGTIKVAVHELELPKIHEEALRMTTSTHKTSYGMEIPPPPANYDRYPTPTGLPAAVYHFRYRSRDVLLRESIIPRPRTLPIPPENLARTSPIQPREEGGGEKDKNEDGGGMAVAEDHLAEVAARVEARRGFTEFVNITGAAGAASSSSSRAPISARTAEFVDLTEK